MAISLEAIQAHSDRELRAKLAAERGVHTALAKLKQRSSGYGFVARRRLLTNALRLTRSMAPEVADALAECKERIGFRRPVEVYVRPEPSFNAFCLENPSGPIIVCLASRLLEVFTPAELQFVIGHELGHAAFDHFAIPMPQTALIEDAAGPIVGHATSLDLYLWCRSAELTADRVGLVCSQDPHAAASSFFKLASGMASSRVNADLEAFAAQVESLASVPQAREQPRDNDETLDCYSTHPYSPVRVRALVAFSKSRLYSEAVGQGPQGISDADLTAIIDRDVKLMDPSYLEDKTVVSKMMRKLLYKAGVLIAAANREIVEKEIRALRALLGADMVDETIEIPDMETLKAEVAKLAEEAVQEADFSDRTRLVQHLTIIAGADGEVDDLELAEMECIADWLEVPHVIIDQTLAGASKPMD
jgi:Zn-dependent protease with chaperone function